MLGPRIERHLIADEGEIVIDEVRKHWAAMVAAILELFGGIVVLLVALFVPAEVWWLPVVLGGAVIVHASWRILGQRWDRFVITNMRVFRMNGILSQRIATMPLARILDISVHKPFLGRVFGYGHFIFESAAQAQGLREIRYVGSPDARGLTIQRVIQQAGLRGNIPQPAAARREVQAPAAETQPLDLPAGPPVPASVDWLEDARRRENARIAELRGETVGITWDPDRTTTAPIELPR